MCEGRERLSKPKNRLSINDDKRIAETLDEVLKLKHKFVNRFFQVLKSAIAYI